MSPKPTVNRQMRLMEEARARPSFDSRQLTYIIYGGEENVRHREEILSRVEQEIGEDGRQLPRVYRTRSRQDLLHEGLRSGRAMLKDELRFDHKEFELLDVYHEAIITSSSGLNAVMFIPTIQLQGDRKQRDYWLPLAESGAILGAYCQTELGHGTFVRGLETTAQFDAEADEFIIHSPTLTSTKYWSSAVGYTASHAVVMARLLVHGVDHGVHAFIVQLRSLNDGKPLPGIELGEVGSSLGLNGTDTGYVTFDHVRIPRRNMMMGQAKVARDGTYTPAPPSSQKHACLTRVYAKTVVIHSAAFQLAKAAIIAIRYSTVREQGVLDHCDPSQSGETPIIAYKSQNYRLLTILSQAYALHFASEACTSLFEDCIRGECTESDAERLAYLHMTLTGMKTYSAQTAADSAEDARRACGGHGYPVLSGLPDIVCNTLVLPILEGDNYVMYQQTARYLVKQAKRIRQNRPFDNSIAYLGIGYTNLRNRNDIRLRSVSTDAGVDFDVLLDIFHHRAVRCIFECEEKLRLAEDGGSNPQQAWNTYMMDLILAARYHVECFVLESFIRRVSHIQDVSVRRVMMQLCNLYALTTIENPFAIGSSAFLEDEYMSTTQLKDIRRCVNKILDALVPEAIGLTDAWNFSDVTLRSALGRKDGNVYEVLVDWTRQLPSNEGMTDKFGPPSFTMPLSPCTIRSKL